MIEVAELEMWAQSHVLCRDGRYRIAKPVPGFVRQRLRDALAVFRGDAVAVCLYDGHESVEELRARV